jgi:hypothetical protein
MRRAVVSGIKPANLACRTGRLSRDFFIRVRK